MHFEQFCKCKNKVLFGFRTVGSEVFEGTFSCTFSCPVPVLLAEPLTVLLTILLAVRLAVLLAKGEKEVRRRLCTTD